MKSCFTLTDNILKRFFFIFGFTKDRFCENNHIVVDLDRVLFKHLSDIGYKRIIFYSMDEQLYFYDSASFYSTREPDEVPKEKIAEKPAVRSNRLQGPIPGRFKSAEAVNSNNASHASDRSEARLHFGKMDSRMAFDRINYCVRDRKKTKIKTAVIFTNADDFIRYFVEDINRSVFDSFNRFDGLPPDNHNIVLFVFPEGRQSDVIAGYRDTFFEKRITSANTININPPELGEIRNTINHFRLMHGLKIDFSCLDTICKKIARELYREHRPLKWLMLELEKIAEKNIVLDTGRCLKMFCNKNDETAIEKLERLVGMESVKEEIKMLESRKTSNEQYDLNEKFQSRVLPPVLNNDGAYNLHYVITGNPGTGKTTAARLLGEIMYESGYLNSGHTVEAEYNDLVSQFNPGDTADKTNRKLEEAMGGVLFIDEAYTLAPVDEQGGGNWGKMAIDTILKAMSDRNGQFSVVAAGYPEQMKTFIDSNPGLKRRFLKTIHIEDYDHEELMRIFLGSCRKNAMRKRYILGDALQAILASFFENWHKSRDKNWGNAGEVEKLLQEMDGSWQKRRGEKSAEGGLILDVCDIPANLKKYCKPSEMTKEDAMNKLRKLTGLTGVKNKIEKLKRKIHFEGAAESGHYVFSGNPGTGKTTVARLLGDILREEGVLRKGHVVEVLRQDLVAGYVGQTAIKTEAKLKEALDGIFFVDEAYSLNDAGQGSGFGKEAIETILAFMENNRTRICAIFAGYTKDMQSFIQSNPGLTSRISETLIFDDYNTNELTEILRGFAGDFILEAEYIQKSGRVFDLWIKNKDSSFGNARDVRKYFGECKDVLYERLSSEYNKKSDIPENVRKTLTGQDIPYKYLQVTGGK